MGLHHPEDATTLIPYVDPHAAQELFRHKVFAFLRRKELITEQRVELLSSWKHSGFSVHNSVYVPPGDHQALEALVRYMMRPPVSLARLKLLPGSDQVLHFPKGSGDDPSIREARAHRRHGLLTIPPFSGHPL